jgi:hypothetical protein
MVAQSMIKRLKAAGFDGMGEDAAKCLEYLVMP